MTDAIAKIVKGRWRWARAKMYRTLRAEGNAGEARRMFLADRAAKQAWAQDLLLYGSAMISVDTDGAIEHISCADWRRYP